MKGLPGDPVGVLIIRLWLESDHPTPLRARITSQSLGAKTLEQSTALAASADDIYAVVRQWVENAQGEVTAR